MVLAMPLKVEQSSSRPKVKNKAVQTHSSESSLSIAIMVATSSAAPNTPFDFTIAGFHLSLFNDDDDANVFHSEYTLRIKFRLSDAALDVATIMAIDKELSEECV
jgi:hypothetical protein